MITHSHDRHVELCDTFPQNMLIRDIQSKRINLYKILFFLDLKHGTIVLIFLYAHLDD